MLLNKTKQTIIMFLFFKEVTIESFEVIIFLELDDSKSLMHLSLKKYIY